MRLAITATGTRGDMQPFLTLGLGLQQAGFSVVLIAPENGQALADAYGLPFRPISVDIQKIMEEPEVQQMTKSNNVLKFFLSHRGISARLKTLQRQAQREVWEAVQDADAIIYHPGMGNAFYMAQELNVPSIMVSPFPLTTTADYPAILLYNGPRLGGWYNTLTHSLVERIFWGLSKGDAKAFWAERGQPNRVSNTPVSRLQVESDQPTIYAYSQHLFPRPTDWPANIYVPGYFNLPADPTWMPSTELTRFIEAGPPPVYIGFGSIKQVDTFARTVRTVREALWRTGQRAILALGWNKLPVGETLPENIFLLDSAPHSWLFPHMAAVVHHGGAGTTHAGLLAGKPTLIIPHTADQPGWGRRVYELGVGAEPIPQKQLTPDRLAAGLRELTNPTMIAKAAQIGQKMRQEGGVTEAAQVVSTYLKR